MLCVLVDVVCSLRYVCCLAYVRVVCWWLCVVCVCCWSSMLSFVVCCVLCVVCCLLVVVDCCLVVANRFLLLVVGLRLFVAVCCWCWLFVVCGLLA